MKTVKKILDFIFVAVSVYFIILVLCAGQQKQKEKKMTDVKVMTNEDIKDEAKIQQEKDLKALMNTIVQLKQLEGLNIDLLGSWLWIGGNTKANKEALKALGCRWASKKKLWYWHCESETRRHYKKSIPIEEIEAKYGKQTISRAS